MTLLEKLDKIGTMAFNSELKLQELRRAIAIAQRVLTMEPDMYYTREWIIEGADELLAAKGQE